MSRANLKILKYLLAFKISSSASSLTCSIPSVHMSRSSLHFLGTVFLIFSRQPETNYSYKTKLGLKLPALVEALDGADDASERENICIG